MPLFRVTWKAITRIDIVAATASEARCLARKQLDPDVDWDAEDTEELEDDNAISENR